MTKQSDAGKLLTTLAMLGGAGMTNDTTAQATVLRKSAYPNTHNIPFLSLPLTGPYAIAVKRPIVGHVRMIDGDWLAITEGEYCLRLVSGERMRCHPDNRVKDAHDVG